MRTEGAVAAAEASEHNLVIAAEAIASGLELLAEQVRSAGLPHDDRPDYLGTARAIVTGVVEGVACLGLGDLISRATAAEEARAALEAPEAAVRASESPVPAEELPPEPDAPLIVLADALVGISVCVPGEWDVEQVAKETNAARPTGIRSVWSFTPGDGDEVFECDSTPGRRHWQLSC